MRRKSKIHGNLTIDARRIINEETPFAIREAYRSLYTNIMYLPLGSKCRKIVFTSAYPGEGKTSVSINLAYTIASTSPESKILLIDADMRSPRVAQLLGVERRDVHGLSEYLAGIDEEPNLVNTIYNNLSLLTSGAESANTPALLASSRMASLIEYVDNKFDYVIFDTPPVNVVADAIFLGEHIDGFIMVARADYSDVNSLNEAVNTIKKVDGNILGIVLSFVDSKKVKKYGRYGRYGRYASYDVTRYYK